MVDSMVYKIRLKKGEFEFEAEGSRDFVEAHLKDWKSNWAKKKQMPSEDVQAPRAIEIKETSLSEYYAQKNPSTHGETIAVFASYYDQKGKGELSPADFLKAYDGVRIKRPKNIHDILQKTYRRQGYIIPGQTRGSWKISRTGLEAIGKLPVKKGKAE